MSRTPSHHADRLVRELHASPGPRRRPGDTARLNRTECAEAGIGELSERQYHRRFRLLRRMEADAASWHRRPELVQGVAVADPLMASALRSGGFRAATSRRA
ncbi:hypothetical protein ACGFZK_04160 [Streptomyces sp. NPDC048257]|uniref:hypothetical protein n=1 Tax=Streptomyces sp. NPDC048257 TaxID=3365526 RepID=UPI003710CBA7